MKKSTKPKTGFFDKYDYIDKYGDKLHYENFAYPVKLPTPLILVCYESCFLSYMESGGAITKYLTSKKFENGKVAFAGSNGSFHNRNDAIKWFKMGIKPTGNEIGHSFETDILKGEEGDMVFIGDGKAMAGHVMILSDEPILHQVIDAKLASDFWV